MNIIEVKNLTFGYCRDNPIISSLSFAVESGSFLAIIGPNGVGKTTLLNLLASVLCPDDGSITIDSLDIHRYSIKKLARKIAVVRQQFTPVFEFTVHQTVSMARMPFISSLGFETEEDLRIVAESLELTETSRLASRTLAHLSGGERQRVFIARALAQSTSVLLLDEPTSFLDLKHQVGIYDLLKKLQLEKGKTIITVTHDINLAAQYADNVLLIGPDSHYLIGKPSAVLSCQTIQKTFDVAVTQAFAQNQNFFLPLGKFPKP